MSEIWKDIEGYESLYQVSNLGRVKSLARNTGNQYANADRILKQKVCKTGYMSVGLVKDKRQKHFFVHRLVAMAFIPNPDNLPQVNHKDEDKTNNCVENLEWCTIQHNMLWGSHIKSYERIINKPNRPDLSKPVLQYTLDGKLINKYPSISEAERQTNIKNTHISGCCQNKYGYKTAGGYLWRYAS